jgi:uncharacterized protein YbaR (Trm112 family)
MHTVSLTACHRQHPDGDVLEGTLTCDHPACAAAYPILDGIPILVADLAGLVRAQGLLLVERDLHPATAALLAAEGPDDEPYPRLLEHLSIYLDAHWGDQATPPPDGPGAERGPLGLAELMARLGARAAAPVDWAVELGASVGRGLAELARGARHVVGIDLHFGALRRARRLLRGEPLDYPRRVIGRHYQTATIHPTRAAPIPRLGAPDDPSAPGASLALLCGDALDPPLVPRRFGRVAALHLLDSVRSPATLLAVADKLCAPAGELLLSSPFSWQSGVVDEAERLGAADPAGELCRRLTAGQGLEAHYRIEERADLAWWLRRDQRSAHLYSTCYLRATKLPPTTPTS